jgi:predicted transcriptional regulator
MAVKPDPVLQAQAHLTERDHLLLEWLYEHRVLTSFQIAHALFPSLDFAQKRLTKLVQLGVIARFRHQRAGGGSLPYHYVLDQAGFDVVTAQHGDEEPVRRTLARARRQHLTSRANLPHLLGCNQFFIDLAGYARTHPGASLDRWWSTRQIITPFAFSGPGEYFIFPGRPDGHGVFTEDGQQVAFWLEYDASTEPLSTLVAKVVTYGRVASQPTDIRTLNGPLRRWPVLFSLGSWQRESHLHQELARTQVRVPVATTSRDTNHARRRSPAEAVWWLHQPTTTGTGAGGSSGIPKRLRLTDLPEAIRTQPTSHNAPRAPSTHRYVSHDSRSPGGFGQGGELVQSGEPADGYDGDGQDFGYGPDTDGM